MNKNICLSCTFCGKSSKETNYTISGPMQNQCEFCSKPSNIQVAICSECVKLCINIMIDEAIKKEKNER